MKIRNTLCASLAVLAMAAGTVCATCETDQKALKNQYEMFAYYKKAMVEAKRAHLKNPKNHMLEKTYEDKLKQYQNSESAWMKNSMDFENKYHAAYDNPSACTSYHKGTPKTHPRGYGND
ncbi:MAG: hypothetical protein JSS34_05250 [Proteobacteria bacterium]|nr:hypothetical protein [Pseudomonadota bacterium]